MEGQEKNLKELEFKTPLPWNFFSWASQTVIFSITTQSYHMSDRLSVPISASLIFPPSFRVKGIHPYMRRGVSSSIFPSSFMSLSYYYYRIDAASQRDNKSSSFCLLSVWRLYSILSTAGSNMYVARETERKRRTRVHGNTANDGQFLRGTKCGNTIQRRRNFDA